MDFDVLTLSRIQFAANITFHILFPTISIALGWVLLWFKTAYRRSGDAAWLDAYYFWVKVFALTFALGVVSGITMSFQFGTNWPGYMQTVGDIAGPLLAYEVLTAFFLEATFLGIMLFGRQKVGERMHTFATFLVAFGTTVSAFWIIVLNSWMQTPAGFEMVDGRAVVTDWLAVIFNPSMPYRLSHMLLASALTVAFLVAGVSTWRWRRGDRSGGVANALKTALIIAAVLAPLQAFLGDLHGLNTLKHQPAKIAAIEGIWHTERGAPLQLFALPNAETRTNDYSIAIPKLASLILTHELDGELKGISAFGDDHPPVAKVFWSFRVMVGVGLAMLLIGVLGAWQFCRRGTLAPWLSRALVWMSFSGWIATVAGWYVAEIGRQPWLVQGVLRTADAVTKVPGGMVASTLVMYLLLYVVLLATYVSVVFHMAGKASKAALQSAQGE